MCGNLQDNVKVRQLFSLTSLSNLDTNLGEKMFAMVLVGNKTTKTHYFLKFFINIVLINIALIKIILTVIIIFIATIFRCCRYSASFLPSWRWSTVSCSLSFLWTRDSLLWYWGHDDGDDDFGVDNVDADGDEKLRWWSTEGPKKITRLEFIPSLTKIKEGFWENLRQNIIGRERCPALSKSTLINCGHILTTITINQAELSAVGTKWEVENTLKCSHQTVLQYPSPHDLLRKASLLLRGAGLCWPELCSRPVGSGCFNEEPPARPCCRAALA